MKCYILLEYNYELLVFIENNLMFLNEISDHWE